MVPGPGPASQGVPGLEKTGGRQAKTQPRHIAGGPQQSGGVVAEAVVVQQPQLALGQIELAAMGIEQLGAAALPIQHQGHGIDTEIAPGQVVV